AQRDGVREEEWAGRRDRRPVDPCACLTRRVFTNLRSAHSRRELPFYIQAVSRRTTRHMRTVCKLSQTRRARAGRLRAGKNRNQTGRLGDGATAPALLYFRYSARGA